MPSGGDAQRAMVVIRKANGGLIIHNAIALEPVAMKQLEDWGRPEILMVPNGYHRQDAFIYKERYPHMRVVCPSGARKKVAQVVSVDATVDDEGGEDGASIHHMEGLKKGEAVLTVRSGAGTSLVFCDALLNMPRSKGLRDFFLAPTGKLSVPRVVRVLGMNDKSALRSHIMSLSQTPGLKRILVGHGASIEVAAAEQLVQAAATLG